MPPASSSPVVGEGTNFLSTSVAAITHPTLVHVGAQFHQESGVPKAPRLSRYLGSVDGSTNLTDKSSCQNNIERYLQSADKIEIMCVGMQTSQSARLFYQHLIRIIDELLLQLEATAT